MLKRIFNKRSIIVLSTVLLTGIIGLFGVAYLNAQLKPSARVGEVIGASIAPLFLTAFVVFIECILFLIIYRNNLRDIILLVFPLLLLTCIPAFMSASILGDILTFSIPKAGKRPVSIEQYNKDKQGISSFYNEDALRQGYSIDNTNVSIDTIIYSPQLNKFVSTIIIQSKYTNYTWYSAALITGVKTGDHWKFINQYYDLRFRAGTKSPDSIPTLCNAIRRQLYFKYSINGSSGNKDIWADNLLFKESGID